jgi:UTP:GlnB (protein PII) uridylyltransferase
VKQWALANNKKLNNNGVKYMAKFNMTDRKGIMDYIFSFTEQNEHIMALVAVGSGSFGYIDELSDLDMVIAIDKDENIQNPTSHSRRFRNH